MNLFEMAVRTRYESVFPSAEIELRNKEGQR